MTHIIKLDLSFASAVILGQKNFEIRKNDRNYQTGDLLKFSVIDKNGNKLKSSLEQKEFEITYVLSGWGLNPGVVALGIRKLGYWIESPSFIPGSPFIRCSECGEEALLDESGNSLSQFCPFCGTRMKGVVKNDIH